MVIEASGLTVRKNSAWLVSSRKLKQAPVFVIQDREIKPFERVVWSAPILIFVGKELLLSSQSREGLIMVREKAKMVAITEIV